MGAFFFFFLTNLVGVHERNTGWKLKGLGFGALFVMGPDARDASDISFCFFAIGELEIGFPYLMNYVESQYQTFLVCAHC